MSWPPTDRLPVPRRAGRGHRTPPAIAKLLSLARRGFPFQPLSPADPSLAALRRTARRALLSVHPSPVRELLRLSACLLWPIGAILETSAALRATPPIDRPDRFPAWARRGAGMLSMALLRNVPPRDYLLFRLHTPSMHAEADHFLFRTDLGLLGALNRSRGADERDVRDKARFAALCSAKGFSTIPTLAAYRGGSQVEPKAPFLPAEPHLWVKDLAGSKGSGATQWDRDAVAYRDSQGRTLTPGELVEEWRVRDCIVQPRLRNHAALNGLTDGPLVDLRLISGLDPEGSPHLVAAYALLPCTAPEGRRWFALAEIEPDEGRLVRPTLSGLQPLTRHPNTGAIISDVLIPDWRRCRDHALGAHEAVFPRFAFLGWDVAPTPEGPVLIEANDGWDLVTPQLALGRPLGRTVFADLAFAHLERTGCA